MAEKKSLHAAEQDSAEGQIRRRQWIEETGGIDPEKLIFLGESGVTTKMTRRYGRAKARRRDIGEPSPCWERLVTPDGGPPWWSRRPPTGMSSRRILEQVLCPRLRPGDVVMMSNLTARKVDGVRTRIEAAGSELRYLPPYSPDLNPIEKCWSQVKQRLRAIEARSLITLKQALTEALSVVTQQNLQVHFCHCG